jgi:hypothetical protein
MKPIVRREARANLTASFHFASPFANLRFEASETFFDTILPRLFFMSMTLVKPPVVRALRPANTADFARGPFAIMVGRFERFDAFFIRARFIAFFITLGAAMAGQASDAPAFIPFIAFIIFITFIVFIAFIAFIALQFEPVLARGCAARAASSPAFATTAITCRRRSQNADTHFEPQKLYAMHSTFAQRKIPTRE